MDSPKHPDFQRLIARIAVELGERGLGYILIGGQAVLLHGEPRLTQDIDITLAADPGRLDDLLGLCHELELRPIPDEVDSFVRRTFVLPVAEEASGIRIDFIFSTTPYEREAISRADTVDVLGTLVAFASAEDLILHKLFAGRARDIEDVRGVLRRKGSTIEWPYIQRWAAEFAGVPGRETAPDLARELREEFEGD